MLNQTKRNLTKPKPPSERHSDDSEKKGRHDVNAYLRYSGMAFEMAAIIGLGLFIGKKLDTYFQTEKPYFLLACTLGATIGALYLTLKDILFKNKK